MRFQKVLLVSCTIIFFSGCSLRDVKPSGVVIERKEAIGDLSSITLAGNFKVMLKDSDQNYLTIKGDSAYLAHLSVEHKKKRLIIEADRNWMSDSIPVVHLYLQSTPSKIELAGAARLISQKRMQTNAVQLDMTGAARADLNMRVNEIFVNQSGASILKISGATENFMLNIAGASQCDAKNFPARNVKTSVSGASKGEVFPIERLNVTLSGASTLKYIGSPAIKSNISGNATLSIIE